MNSIKLPSRLSRFAEFGEVRAEGEGGATLVLPGAILATESPVFRQDWGGGYDEILPMRTLDASRIGNIPLPMFFGHRSEDLPIGMWEGVAVRGKELVATGKVTRSGGTVTIGYGGASQPMSEVREAIRNRSLRGTSIGYRINVAVRLEPGCEWEEFKAGDRPALIAKSWTLFEASLTPVPADPGSYLRTASDAQIIDVPIEGAKPKQPAKGKTMKRRFQIIFREMPAEGEPKDTPVAEGEGEETPEKSALQKMLEKATDEEAADAIGKVKASLAAKLKALGGAEAKAAAKTFDDYVRTLPETEREFYREQFSDPADAKRYREIQEKQKVRDSLGKQPLGSAGTGDKPADSLAEADKRVEREFRMLGS